MQFQTGYMSPAGTEQRCQGLLANSAATCVAELSQ